MSSKPGVDFVRTFTIAALETLKVQCNYVARAGKPVVKKPEDPKRDVAIAGVIGITSEHFRGTIAICFPEKSFLAVMSGMLGETFNEINKDLEDGAAELMNIIFGCAKKSLSDKGFTVERAIPSVVRGKGIDVKHLSKEAAIIIPFDSERGPFHIEVVIE